MSGSIWRDTPYGHVTRGHAVPRRARHCMGRAARAAFIECHLSVDFCCAALAALHQVENAQRTIARARHFPFTQSHFALPRCAHQIIGKTARKVDCWRVII
jgi:hypothetical protein